MPRAVAIVLHPGFQLLDMAGPNAAFELAGRFQPDGYAVTLLAPGGGDVESSSGFKLAAQPFGHRAVDDPAFHDQDFDTVIVSGGEIVRCPAAAARIVAWLRSVRARRIASVCSGAFLLAEAGLLDGRRATTHWASTEDFAHRYPAVKLQPERIYIEDGGVWTSAGISAGIDLALALIEDDYGEAVARRTAQALVVHHRRPGGQLQYAALMELGGRSGRFVALIHWMRAHLAEPLTVERLADRAAMSPRHFARAFAEETGTTPAKAVERLRLEMARTALEGSRAPLEQIARDTGFGDAGRMRRAFLRSFGQPPQAIRRAMR